MDCPKDKAFTTKSSLLLELLMEASDQIISTLKIVKSQSTRLQQLTKWKNQPRTVAEEAMAETGWEVEDRVDPHPRPLDRERS